VTQNKDLEAQVAKLTEESKAERTDLTAQLTALNEQHTALTARHATLETELKAVEDKWRVRLDEAEHKSEAEKHELTSTISQLRTELAAKPAGNNSRHMRSSVAASFILLFACHSLQIALRPPNSKL
jgi:hypothetical protein